MNAAERRMDGEVMASGELRLKRLLPLEDRLRMALREDLGAAGDVTSQALVPERKKVVAEVLVKADGVLCGVNLLPLLFPIAAELVMPRAGNRRRPRRSDDWKAVRVAVLKADGGRVRRGDIAATVEGEARVLLAGERVALNLLCRLSGIATQAAQYVAKVAHTRAKIVDTRKTTPLWRDLEKYAVTCGGAENHRRGLFDMILIKDNHLALWGAQDPAGAVHAAQKRFPGVPVQVEVVDLAGVLHVCRHSQPEMILLDNFTPAVLREAVQWCKEFFASARGEKTRPLLEASGNVNLDTVVEIAETGVDRISVGALTHSVRGLDISLELRR